MCVSSVSTRRICTDLHASVLIPSVAWLLILTFLWACGGVALWFEFAFPWWWSRAPFYMLIGHFLSCEGLVPSLLPIFLLGCLQFSYWFLSILIQFGYGFFVGSVALPSPHSSLWLWCHLLLFYPLIIPFPPLTSYSLNMPCQAHSRSTLASISAWNVLSQRSTWVSSPSPSSLCSTIPFLVTTSLIYICGLTISFIHCICHPYPSLKKRKAFYQQNFQTYTKLE